ncbi:MAG: hypothetical protein B6242_12225 [Anaerolineaceae bacterium 4572_78]|nr:MAG: hypothetical protein B6242_12225 [Anaerolineaceae bacterium 4572_78]
MQEITANKNNTNIHVNLAWKLAIIITLLAFFSHVFYLHNTWSTTADYDPAYNGIDALRIVRYNLTPIFFPANGGREPLFHYLQAMSFWLFGVNNFILYLPGTLAGVLAIPALFTFTRTLFRHEDTTIRIWTSLWAAAGLSMSGWHVSHVGLGLRAAVLPVMSIGVMYVFIHAWRRNNTMLFVLSGMLLGLTAYTYTSARFLPFVITLAVIPSMTKQALALHDKANFGTPSSQILKPKSLNFILLAISAMIIFSPLAWYYITHPVMFDERAASIMVWNVLEPGSESTLAEEMILNAGRTLSWFTRLPILLFIGFIVGLIINLRHIYRLENRLLFTWWFIMLFPDWFTIESPDPLRLLAVTPPTYIIIAYGWAKIISVLPHPNPSPLKERGVRFPSPYGRGARGEGKRLHGWSLIGMMLIILTSAVPYWQWVHPQEKESQLFMNVLCEILFNISDRHVIYLQQTVYAEPSMRFCLAKKYRWRSVNKIATTDEPIEIIIPLEGQCLFCQNDFSRLVRLSPNGWASMLPPITQDGQANLAQHVKKGKPIYDKYGQLIAHMAIIPNEFDPVRYLQKANHHAKGSVINVADIVGYTLENNITPPQPSITPLAGEYQEYPHIIPGKQLYITTYWQAHGTTSEDYDMVVHLIDDNHQVWGQADGMPYHGGYTTSLWQENEPIADKRLMWVYPQTPVGRYRLAVAFYDYASDKRIPVAESQSMDTLYLGPLKVPLPTLESMPTNTNPMSAYLGNVAQLLGYQLKNNENDITLTLYWQAENPTPHDYTVFVHVLNEGNEMVTGQDSMPVGGMYPTNIWEKGEIIPDERVFNMANLPHDSYRFAVGMYLLETGERLPIRMADGTTMPDSHLILEKVIKLNSLGN